MSLNDIFVWLWLNHGTSPCETYAILGRFLHKNKPILLSMPQIINVADHIINMYFLSCFSCFLHKIKTTAYRWKFRILGVRVISPFIENDENYVWYVCQIMRYVSEREVYREVSMKIHGSKWNIFLVLDEHRVGSLRNGGNYRPIF